MSTEILYAKLKEINEQCAPERKQKKLEDEQKERDKDPFNRQRKELAEKIREIRTAIDERDSLYQKGDRVAGVKSGTRIRQTLMKDAQRMAEELEKEHKKRKKGPILGSASDEKKKSDEDRQKIVGVMKQHLQELDKAERTIKTSTTNDMEISESSEVEHGEKKVNVLPDLDDPIFDQVNSNEKLIDSALGVILEKVQIIKNDAVEIGQELDEQQQVVQQVTSHVENTFTSLKTVNTQLKETLQEVRSARTFCCDIILCLLILGIAGAIYGLVSKHT